MLQMRKLKHREIKSLVQSYRVWESQDLNTSSRSHALTHHTHSIPWCKCPWRGNLSGLVPGLLVLAFPEMCLVFPGPWAIVPTPDLEICSHSEMQFFHSMGALCFCQLSLWVPRECVAPLYAVRDLWGPGPACG